MEETIRRIIAENKAARAAALNRHSRLSLAAVAGDPVEDIVEMVRDEDFELPEEDSPDVEG